VLKTSAFGHVSSPNHWRFVDTDNENGVARPVHWPVDRGTELRWGETEKAKMVGRASNISFSIVQPGNEINKSSQLTFRKSTVIIVVVLDNQCLNNPSQFPFIFVLSFCLFILIADAFDA